MRSDPTADMKALQEDLRHPVKSISDEMSINRKPNVGYTKENYAAGW